MCSVLPLRRESLRAWRIARLALRFNTAFLAIATTYSTPGSASRKASKLGMGEAAIETNANAHSGKKVADQLHQSAQNPHRARRRRHVAGAQYGGTQILFRLVIEADETHHRQVAPGVVMAVEKRQLLRPVRGIVGRVQIQSDAARTTAQALGMTLDHAGRQRFAQTIKFLHSDGVLKTRQRRLRSQIAARARIAVQQQLVNRIGGQASRIVGVRIAARDREHTLRQKFLQGMIDLARLPLVSQAVRHANCPAADRTAARQACGKGEGTTNTVSCYCQTRESLSCYCKLCFSNMFVAEEAFRVFKIMNKAG